MTEPEITKSQRARPRQLVPASTGLRGMRTGAGEGVEVGMRAHLTTVPRPRPRATGRAALGRSATTRAARECTRVEVEVAGARRSAAQGAAMAAMVGRGREARVNPVSAKGRVRRGGSVVTLTPRAR